MLACGGGSCVMRSLHDDMFVFSKCVVLAELLLKLTRVYLLTVVATTCMPCARVKDSAVTMALLAVMGATTMRTLKRSFQSVLNPSASNSDAFHCGWVWSPRAP